MDSDLDLQDQSAGPLSDALESGTANRQTPSPAHPTLRALRAQAEIHAITRALHETGWNRKRAAQILSISYRGLLYKIQEHKITPELAEHAENPGETK